MYKKIITTAYIIVFIFGIFLILGSDIYNFGSAISMRYAGAIISIFSGLGFLLENYLSSKK